MTDTSTSTTATRARGLQAYLCVDGAARALDFYREAFGAVETTRMTDDSGKVGHAETRIGDVELMLADEHPEMGVLSPTTLGGSPVLLYLVVDDVDAVHDRAVAAGATSLRPPEDQFHGNRTATVSDPFGHRWMLSQPVEHLSADELAARGAADGYETQVATGATGRLGYFTISVPDVDRAAAFYGALFGWAFDPAGPAQGEHRYRHVGNAGVPFGVHDDMGDQSPHHYYRVSDIEAAAERVRDLGGEVLETATSASGGTARCRDDQGVEFDLWQPASGYE